MTVRDVLQWLNAIAPFDSAEDFDNPGLNVGNENVCVTGVLFGLDATEALVETAVDTGANLIVTHHPLIFHGIKRIDYTAPQGRILRALLSHDVHLIAAHTNWDKAPGGVSDSLAATLGLCAVERGDDYVRVGALASPMTADSLVQAVESAIGFRPRVYGVATEPITRVAVAGGAYGEGYEVALRMGAQAYLTGEVKHHEILDACARGLMLLDGGHYATEEPGISALFRRYLKDAEAWHMDAPARLVPTAPFAGDTLAL